MLYFMCDFISEPRLLGFVLLRLFRVLLFIFVVLGGMAANADPLAETREILFVCPIDEPECEQGRIANLAAELETPAAIFEYVRNSHEYALYHGSRSNTINTFYGSRGSDVDIASVLIAMFRSQNIPSRYAKAIIRASASDVANWLGVKDISLAAAVLDDQGIQNVNLLTNDVGSPVIEFEHVWVQVQVPYSDYRGAFNSTVDCMNSPDSCSWIDVDPSWKSREYHKQNIDVYGVVDFDYDRYYNAIKNDDADYRDKGPLEIYEMEILDWLAVNHPGKTLEDVADPGTIIPVYEGLLPASLPYEVVEPVLTYNSIEEHDALSNPKWAKFVTLQTTLNLGGLTISAGGGTYPLSDLTTKRLTLTYKPQTLNEAGQVQVRLDGEVVATPITTGGTINGQIIGVGTPFSLNADMDGAPSTTNGQSDGAIEVTYSSLIVGGYYLVGVGGDTSNWSQVHRAARQLLEANESNSIVNDENGIPYVDANKNGLIDQSEIPLLDDLAVQDKLTGGLLYVAMNQYYTRFVDNIRRLDDLNHVISPLEGFIGIVSSTYDVDYLGDTAFSVMPGGLLIDMKGLRFNGSWINDEADSFASEHFELIGHESSSLEHEIWQELTGFDAVSTVRGIQMALASGSSLLHLNDGSVNTINNMYSDFGFSSAAPSPFSINVRDVFDTRPTTWGHPTTAGEQGFDVLKKYPSNGDLHTALLNYKNGYWHGNVGCFDNQEQAILDLINQYGGGASLDAGNVCGFSYPSGTTLSQLLTGFKNYFYNFYDIGSDGYFDYLDQYQGFSPSDFVFRSHQASVDIHGSELVQGIRNALIFGGTVGGNQANWEYVIPSRKTNTGFNVFSVYLRKIYDDVDDTLVSQSFSISNDSFVAGGGWVDGSSSLSLADVSGSVVKPTFENRVFTDENLVAVTNNDLIRTPSTADPVSTVTGNMYHDETDFSIKNRGLPYVFTRSYNSGPGRVDQDGPLGFGWTHSYNMSLRSNDYGTCPNCTSTQAMENGNDIPSSISYIDERGGEHTYILNSDGAGLRYVSENPPGEFDSLLFNTPNSGQHTLQFRNGVKYVFEESGNSLLNSIDNTARLKYIADAYNNRLNLTYDGNDRLITVVDELGISGRTGLTFSYEGTSTHIKSVMDWTGRAWTFGYDGEGNLDFMMNPLNEIMDYTYHQGTHLLNEIIYPQVRKGKKRQMAFSYYRNNKAFNYIDTLGQTETLDYDLYRQRTQVTDPRGFIREHFYDKDNGALIQLKEPDGAILRFENNADGLRYSKRDGLGFLTRYSFQSDRSISSTASTSNGLVTREIDALDRTIDYEYGLYDQQTTVNDKRGNPTTRIYYDSTNVGLGAVEGKLQEVRASLNGIQNVLLVSYSYYADGPAFGQLKQRIEYIDSNSPSRQRITDFVYESNGLNLQSVIISGATNGNSVLTSYTYDSLGRVVTETLQRRLSELDPMLINLTTTYSYDHLDRITHVETPRGDIRETVYDDNGMVLEEKVHYQTDTVRPNCASPAGGYVTCVYSVNTYDAMDRLIQTTDILGHSTHFEYDEMGNLVKQIDANQHSIQFEYDPMGRRVATIAENGYRMEFKYDLAGRLIASKDANGNVTINEYDKLGRLIQVKSAEGRIVQTQYDGNGNATHSLDANAVANAAHPRNSQDVSVYREYDEFNRLKLERDALNGETHYAYDLLGNIKTITDAEGQQTKYIYDDLGRLIETVDPRIEFGNDKTDRVLIYDEAGNVLLTEDRSGRQRRNTYDVLNRLTRSDYLLDSSFDEWVYDDFGDLVSISNDDVTYSYGYSARHELTSKVDSRFEKTLSWSYDPVGNIKEKTDYQGDITTYLYDSSNRLVAMRNPAYLQVSYHYDGAGRLIDRVLSNGAKTRYGYDNDNRLTLLQNYTANNMLVESLIYQHDQMGNITQISDSVSGRIVNYGYDALYRLTSVDGSINGEDRTYTYDMVGNRKTEVKDGTTYYYCYDELDCTVGANGNRLINIRSNSVNGPINRKFTYDDSGRVVSKLDGSDNYIYVFLYNGKGRIAGIYNPITGPGFVKYDTRDYRIQKGERYMHLEGEHLEAIYDHNGEIEKSYLRGVVIDEVVSGFTYHSTDPHDWTNYTFHHDQVNSVTALTGHNGTIEETTKYDAFGAPLSQTFPGTGNDLLFTGREYDSVTGLYYYRARYYDPEIGRFLSEDPLGFKAGINFYAYVNNNPINYSDPTGQLSREQVYGALRVIGGGAETVIGGVTMAGAGWTGAGAVAGGLITLHGLDQVQAGVRQIQSGSHVSSFTSQGLQEAGFSPLAADLTDAGLSFASGGVSFVQGTRSLAVHGADPLAEGLSTFQLISKVEQGSIALNQADYLALGGKTSTALAKADMLATGVNAAGQPYTRTTTLGERLTSSVSLMGTGLTPAGSFTFGGLSSVGGGSNAANGGFVLYPNKPNTNMMNAVYSK